MGKGSTEIVVVVVNFTLLCGTATALGARLEPIARCLTATGNSGWIWCDKLRTYSG